MAAKLKEPFTPAVSSRFQIPEICRNTSILMVVVIAVLLAIAMTVVSAQVNFLTALGKNALYLLWIALFGSVLLCWLRRPINRQTNYLAFSLAFGVCLLDFALVEVTSQWVFAPNFENNQWVFNWEQFWRRGVVATIVALLVLRFFALLSLIEARGQIESLARIQALQSRIRPHFLFNSLNTISELISVNPVAADDAIFSLSKLFRASLDDANNTHDLEAEIELCEQYLELEKWRLDSRLKVTWQRSVETPKRWKVPKLIMQPLIENAVVHGAAKDGSVEITIDIRETKQLISFLIANTIDEGEKVAAGHGMALDNIRERLFVMYDDQHTFNVRHEEGTHQVIMRIPKKDALKTRRS